MFEGLMICLPQYVGSCMAANMRSVIYLVQELERSGYPYTIQFGSDSAVHRVRYIMTEGFMRSSYERLLWIDSDIEFTPDDVGRLMSVIDGGADVAVGCYRLKREGSDFAAHTGGRLMRLDDMTGGVIDVDYAGTGFMLIHRRAFEMIEDGLPNIDTEQYGKIRRWWSFDVDGGVELPEDYGFCHRVRQAGGVVRMDTSVRLTHWGLKGW